MRASTSTQWMLDITVLAALGVGAAVGLAGGLVAGSRGVGARTGTTGAPAPALAAPATPAKAATNEQLLFDHVATLNNLATATRRGDARQVAAYRAKLAQMRKPRTVAALPADAARSLAGVASA
jgi:hypothetical protein